MSEEHKHDHGHDHGHAHDHSHDHKTRFHDPQHAAEFDRRTSEIRDDLAEKLADMLALQGDEQILGLATGTGRVARPVAKRLKTGRIIGVDQALAMLDVGHQHEDPIRTYYQGADGPMLCLSNRTPSTGRLSPSACTTSATQ